MKLNFYPLVDGWTCQAPRHEWGWGGDALKAVALALFVDADAVEQGKILVHQAVYLCQSCRDRMEADLR